MQGVLLVGTVLHGGVDSLRPLKSSGPVSMSAEKKPYVPISIIPQVLQKDEARQEVQKSVPTAPPPVIQEIIAPPCTQDHRAGASENASPPSSQGDPAEG